MLSFLHIFSAAAAEKSTGGTSKSSKIAYHAYLSSGPPTGPGRGPFWPGPAWRATAARPRPGPARLRRAGLASWPGPARQRRAATAWAAKATCTKFMPLSNFKKSGIIFANWLNQSNHCKVIIFIAIKSLQGHHLHLLDHKQTSCCWAEPTLSLSRTSPAQRPFHCSCATFSSYCAPTHVSKL